MLFVFFWGQANLLDDYHFFNLFCLTSFLVVELFFSPTISIFFVHDKNIPVYAKLFKNLSHCIFDFFFLSTPAFQDK